MPTLNLTPNPATDRNYLIFPESPFLLKSLTVSIVATAKSFSSIPLNVSTPLVAGVDFFAAFYYNKATGEMGEAVYGGIAMVDPKLEGTVTYSFTDVGSTFRASNPQISSIYADDSIDPLVAWWDHVVLGLPEFPHQTLVYDAGSQTHIDAVQTAVSQMTTEVTAAVTEKSIFDFNAHVSNTNNPHNDTADAVGLGKVPNWTTGNAASIIAGGSDTEFGTPLSVKDSVATVMPAATVTSRGVAALNLGTTAGDATNATDGLTAGGLVYMLSHGLLDSGASLIDNQRQKVLFSPFPIVYPATWHTHVCNTFEELVEAVQTESGISELTANAAEGAIYFPHTASAPNLTLS
jgi:hypothetical protein